MNTTAFFALFVGVMAVLFGHAVTGLCLIAVGLSILAHILIEEINLDRALLAKWEKLTKGE